MMGEICWSAEWTDEKGLLLLLVMWLCNHSEQFDSGMMTWQRYQHHGRRWCEIDFLSWKGREWMENGIIAFVLNVIVVDVIIYLVLCFKCYFFACCYGGGIRTRDHVKPIFCNSKWEKKVCVQKDVGGDDGGGMISINLWGYCGVN